MNSFCSRIILFATKTQETSFFLRILEEEVREIGILFFFFSAPESFSECCLNNQVISGILAAIYDEAFHQREMGAVDWIN